MDCARQRMVKRIGEMLEVSRLKTIRAARQELRRSQSTTAVPIGRTGEDVFEIEAKNVYESPDGIIQYDIVPPSHATKHKMEKLLADNVERPIHAVVVERYASGGLRRVAADPCKWLVTQIGAGIYRLVRQDRSARMAVRGEAHASE